MSATDEPPKHDLHQLFYEFDFLEKHLNYRKSKCDSDCLSDKQYLSTFNVSQLTKSESPTSYSVIV